LLSARDKGQGRLRNVAVARHLVRKTSDNNPTGVHISLTGDPSEMHIQFATFDSGNPIVEISKKTDVEHLFAADSSVSETRRELTIELGTESGEVNWTKIKGSSTTYLASDMCQKPATSTDPGHFVSPGHLHTVKATNLEPNTEYMYRVGLGFGQGIKFDDKVHIFKSSPSRGARSPSTDEPALRFLALADQGCQGSKSFAVADAKDASAENPPQQVTQLITAIISNMTVNSIHHFGGISYADGAGHVWDEHASMIQSYASHVPVMMGIGDHEYDHTEGGEGKDPSGLATQFGFQPAWGAGNFVSQSGGECGVPASKRFAVPDTGNGIFWYSYDQSLVHTIMLSSEHNLTAGSPQHQWFLHDLTTANRTITPWLVVEMHRPMYNSERVSGGAAVGLGMRSEIEDLLYEYRADLVLSGHYHSYLRTCDGLYKSECDSGGPTYVTVGTGGAPLDNTTANISNVYTEVSDHVHHGVGRVSVYNASALHWEFVAFDKEDLGRVTDSVWIKKNRGL